MRSPDNKPSYEALEALIDTARERIADLEDNECFMSREINYLYSFITSYAPVELYQGNGINDFD